MQLGKKLKLGSLPALFCLLAMLVAACGGSGNGTNTNQTKAPASQQVFRWGQTLTDINTFDPGISTDITSINAIGLVFTGLVQLDNSLKVQPQMASSYKVSSDGMTYTFTLKPNLKFSDGTPLTSADVAYSIDRSLSPAINNQSGVALTYLGLIQGAADRVSGKASTIIGTGVQTPDPNTVVVHITKPAAYFLEAFTYPTAFVVEKSVIDKWGNKWTDHLSDNGGQGGDGPFKVKTYSHTTGIVLVPNPNYYGSKPQLNEIDYQFYNGRQPNYDAYQANQTDYATPPLADYGSLKSNSEFHSTPSLTIFYIGMNYLAKPLDNIHIREALAVALNRDVIIQTAYSGAYIPSCHIVPSGMPGYDSSLTCPDGTGTTGDQTKAKQLFQQGLQEEGLTAATFPKLTYTYPTAAPQTADEVATEVQMWKTVLGITINTATVDQNTLYNQEVATTCSTPSYTNPDPTKCVGKGLQMWTAGWGADYPDPQDWITLQFGDGQPYNEFNFGNNLGSDAANQKALQQQMDAADVMQNPTQRLQTYNTIEQQLVNDVAWLSLYQRPTLSMLKSYVVGLTFNAEDEFPPDSWANVYIASH
jgi:peptide/nickel transport system substrate-binding protein/oligopeptide transport system substrate-binding protein